MSRRAATLSTATASVAPRDAGSASLYHRRASRKGVPNYKRKLVHFAVKKFLPTDRNEWKKVTQRYHELSKEEKMRDVDHFKKYWMRTMCAAGKKSPTNKKRKAIFAAQQVQEKITQKLLAESSERRGAADDDGDGDGGDLDGEGWGDDENDDDDDDKDRGQLESERQSRWDAVLL